MCKTTTPPRPAAQDAIRKFPPNTSAGAVIPLQSYLGKYSSQFANQMVPVTPPALPPNVRSTDVPFSLLPLLANGPSGYYAGVFDDEMHFSASLVKVAALFAAGELHAEATAFAQQGFPSSAAFFSAFNTSIKNEINTTADSRIKNAHIGLTPVTASILNATGFGGPGSPAVGFSPTFTTNMRSMIALGTNEGAGACIKALGYGYISAALIKEGLFDPNSTTGIWLAGTYVPPPPAFVTIPCKNDHPDKQVISSRQMCTLFSRIRLKQLPPNDLDANTTMQGFLSEPKPLGPDGLRDIPWLSPSRNPGVAPLFTVLADKIGVAGLGDDQTPMVYSEGLIVKWNDASQLDSFNNKIDPTNANPGIRLSGEIAICWQNLLAELIPGGTGNSPMFDPVINVINNTLSDFFDQKAL